MNPSMKNQCGTHLMLKVKLIKLIIEINRGPLNNKTHLMMITQSNIDNEYETQLMLVIIVEVI